MSARHTKTHGVKEVMACGNRFTHGAAITISAATAGQQNMTTRFAAASLRKQSRAASIAESA
ncbi:hypothetical protein BBL07_15775 [Agrobacterium vitis]|nr:hypothetical protein BBL07_15775 [Agrobacterium vitis]